MMVELVLAQTGWFSLSSFDIFSCYVHATHIPDGMAFLFFLEGIENVAFLYDRTN